MSETLRFGQLDISFNERMLRPRPWTIAQSQWAAALLDTQASGRVLELCSGAGHIGLALALLAPHDIVMVDIDPNACEYAVANAHSAGLQDRVEVRAAPMQDALKERETFSLILADPPWVRSANTVQFPDDPLLAIDGGQDGMRVALQCVEMIDQHLAADGHAILQLGTSVQCTILAQQLPPTLAIVEVREFGRNGVLVELCRPKPARPERM